MAIETQSSTWLVKELFKNGLQLPGEKARARTGVGTGVESTIVEYLPK